MRCVPTIPRPGLYTDRWLWEEISGEDLSAPFPPPSNEPLVDTWDPNEPFLSDLPDDPHSVVDTRPSPIRWRRKQCEQYTGLPASEGTPAPSVRFPTYLILHWRRTVNARMWIAAVIYMMVQAVTFGVGTVLVLATPLQAEAMKLLPVVVIVSSIASIPISWWMAPRLQARFWRAKRMRSDFISGPAVARSNP